MTQSCPGTLLIADYTLQLTKSLITDLHSIMISGNLKQYEEAKAREQALISKAQITAADVQELVENVELNSMLYVETLILSAARFGIDSRAIEEARGKVVAFKTRNTEKAKEENSVGAVNHAGGSSCPWK